MRVKRGNGERERVKRGNDEREERGVKSEKWGERSTVYLQIIGKFREMNVNVQVFEVSSIIAINMLKKGIFYNKAMIRTYLLYEIVCLTIKDYKPT